MEIKKMNDTYVRARIYISSQKELLSFVNSFYETDDQFTVENRNGTSRVNAGSVIGMMYAMSEFSEEMYIVNRTRDGVFPSFIDKFRKG